MARGLGWDAWAFWKAPDHGCRTRSGLTCWAPAPPSRKPRGSRVPELYRHRVAGTLEFSNPQDEVTQEQGRP